MTEPNVLLVFPRFVANSFWSMTAACELWGAKASCPPLGLITVAALLPQTWNFRLVDRNAEELSDADIAWADMVMTGGMLPQRDDTLRLMKRVRAAGKPVVVGGPDPMACPEIYADADFRVLGEAEGLMDAFVEAWVSGARSGTFEAPSGSVDITKAPIPRFDLIDFSHYLYVGVQFSRGCPFTCEFCDIIEIYGRVPRPKTNEQMIAELQRLYDMGYRGHVDFVDDNLIGNKKALRRFLPALAAWQKEREWPFAFSTEASLNLSDDPELLALMKACNFFVVFVGIESPDTETLVSAQKKQNTRRDIAASVHRIYGAGMFVVAGFIVGFDTETQSVAEEMIACVRETSIPVAMVGLLTALPATQMRRRLEAEGRMLPDPEEIPPDHCFGGLNFVPKRPAVDILRDYREIIRTIFSPEEFFARALHVGLALDRPTYWIRIYPRLLLRDLRLLGRLIWTMTVKQPEMRRLFWKTSLTTLRRNPRAFEFVCFQMVMYLHLHPFSKTVIAALDARIAELVAGGEPKSIAAE
jgi:radical SAM superfamily enzyme YgiQ (UPF0313 family)